MSIVCKATHNRLYFYCSVSLCRFESNERESGGQTDDDDRTDRHIHIYNSLLDALLCYDGVTKNENEKRENFLPHTTNMREKEKRRNHTTSTKAHAIKINLKEFEQKDSKI